MKISSDKNRRQIFGLLLIHFNKIAHPYIWFCCTFETFMVYKTLTEMSCVHCLESSRFILYLPLNYFQGQKLTIPYILFSGGGFFFFFLYPLLTSHGFFVRAFGNKICLKRWIVECLIVGAIFLHTHTSSEKRRKKKGKSFQLLEWQLLCFYVSFGFWW